MAFWRAAAAGAGGLPCSGHNHTAGRDARLLDPASDAARIRAMYTAPALSRRGVGRRILELCEAAARAEGFTRAELGATKGGEPLYRACGYQEIERLEVPTPGRRDGADHAHGKRAPLGLRLGLFPDTRP